MRTSMEASMDRYDILRLFGSIFAVSSCAGLAALLRSGKDLTIRAIVSAMLNAGLLAVAIGLIWFHYFPTNIYFMFGISVLAGLGGTSLLDFILQFIKKGLKVSVKIDDNEEGHK